MNLDTAPDISMRGQRSPYAPSPASPATAGQLVSLVRRLASRPQDWWHLARFTAEPARVFLGEREGAELWLMVWPPGHRAEPRENDATTETITVIVGELSFLTVTPAGVMEQALRSGPVRVLAHPSQHVRVLANITGSAGFSRATHAISLHAIATPGGGTGR